MAAVALVLGAVVGAVATWIPSMSGNGERAPVAAARDAGSGNAGSRNPASDLTGTIESGSGAVHWSAEKAELTVQADDGPSRFRIGAPGDELLLGDWDCDGTDTDTAGIYRPATGETFLFDGWAEDRVLVARPGDVLAPATSPTITHDGGCDRIATDDRPRCPQTPIRQ